MLGKQRIDEGIPAVKQIENGAVSLCHIHEIADWLFKHRLPKFVGETREPLAVDGVVLFETAEIEPISAELGRQAAHARMAQETPRLGNKHVRLVQIAGRGVIEE